MNKVRVMLVFGIVLGANSSMKTCAKNCLNYGTSCLFRKTGGPLTGTDDVAKALLRNGPSDSEKQSKKFSLK